MELTLNVFIYTEQRGFSEGVCKLTYNGFSIEGNDKEKIATYDFCLWKIIRTKIEEVKIDGNEFYAVSIDYSSSFYVLKSDIQKLNEFCYKRNQEMLYIKKNICNYIDNEILNIAENLLNMAEEDVMLNFYVVAHSHVCFSHIESKIFTQDSSAITYIAIDEYISRYKLSKDTYGLKGKTKKDTKDIVKFKEFKDLIWKFVDIIIEEKKVYQYMAQVVAWEAIEEVKVNRYIAEAVAWEAIQRKAIEYYSQKWIDKYENILDKTFNELCTDLYNQNTDKVKYNYIKSVLLCDKIDIDCSQELLMYFLLSKGSTKEIALCDCFIEHYEIIRELKQSINLSNIKQKLKTKQKREITKYTIADIDLMTGVEFEEFIALLFKKMGYFSQVTKQSGDQGIDVIAIKNNTRIGIQAKCYSNTVGNAAIQEVVAGKNFYDCDKIIVVTNNYFTTAAIELAQVNNVILWNRNLLKEKIKEIF